MGVRDIFSFLPSRILSLSDEKGKTTLTLNSSIFFLLSATLMFAFIAATIIWSCGDTFDCTSFWPTVSYLACFRGHDRLVNFTVTPWAVVLALFFLGAATAYKDAMERMTHVIFLFLSFLLVCATPFLVIIDEANSSHAIPLSVIHAYITMIYIAVSLVWIAMSVQAS